MGNVATLSIVYGCMFAGKTTKLISMRETMVKNGKKIAVFHPSIDVRYNLNAITSHDGGTLGSIPLDVRTDHIPATDVDVVIIDEVHFFSENILSAIQSLLKNGIDVYVAGLDKNYKGEVFPVTQKLMNVAVEKVQLFAKCSVCGEPATFTRRTVANDTLIIVGGADMYEARCEKHFTRV